MTGEYSLYYEFAGLEKDRVEARSQARRIANALQRAIELLPLEFPPMESTPSVDISMSSQDFDVDGIATLLGIWLGLFAATPRSSKAVLPGFGTHSATTSHYTGS